MNRKPTAHSFPSGSDLGQTAAAVPGRGSLPYRLRILHRLRHSLPLAEAAKLIRDLGYGRRYEELADAETAAAHWAA